MTLVQEISTDVTAGVRVVDAIEGLSAIRDPDCAAVTWRRDASSRFQTWIDGLDPTRLPRVRTVLRPDAVRDAVSHICDVYKTSQSEERAMLVDDVATLATVFADIMRAPYVRLRLDVVTGDPCKKFHVDAVFARLICTYRGAGTQYGVSEGGAQPTRVITAQTGAPVVLRGTLWPEDPPTGLLHRSPPIAGSGETRLLLVLDPIDHPDEEDD